MIASLSRRDRAALAVGAALMLVIVGVGKGLPALRAWEGSRVAVAIETRRQLGIAEQGAATIGATRDSAASRERRLGILRAVMISAPNVEAAAAKLAAVIEEIAREEGVTVGMVALRPDSVIRSGMARVAVRLTAEGDVEGLAQLLFGVETHETPMQVRELIVAQPDPAAPLNRPEVLRFELYVVTLARLERSVLHSSGAASGNAGAS